MLRAEGLHCLGRQLHHRRHGGVLLFRCRLHQLAPAAYQSKACGVIKKSGECCGSDLAQRKSGCSVRHNSLFSQHLRRRQLHGKQAGLGVGGLLQLLRRAGKALADGSGSQSVTQIEDFPGGGVGFVQLLSHTGELIPLAGKDEGYSTHAVALRRVTSASSTTSRTMSAAGCSLLTIAAI